MSWSELVTAAESIRAGAATVEPELAGLSIEGIAWATVEATRAFEELASVLGTATWVPVDRDPLLGASVWRREPPPGPDARVALLVVEPDTEGRLAACLARFGEGVAAVYLAAQGGPDRAPDRVVAVSPRWGPYAIVRARTW